jgi:integrase
MATIHRLSTRFVATVTAKGIYPDGAGLYLQVGGGSAKGGSAKSWIFRYAVDGRERQMGLGPTYTVSLAEVRELARQCRQQRLNGIDPIEARNAARLEQKLATAREVSFRHCAEGWMAGQQIGWSPRYARQVARTFEKYIYPWLGKIPVQKVDVDLLQRVLEPIHRTQAPTYTNAQMYVEGTLNWAKASGHVTGDNPASLKGPLGVRLLPVAKFHKQKHYEALPYKQIGTFMHLLRTYKNDAEKDRHCRLCHICHSPHLAKIEAAHRAGKGLAYIRAQFGINLTERRIAQHERWRAAGGTITHQLVRPMTSYALEFIVLTTARRRQTVMARWEDIDFEDRIWICPAEDHKAGKTTGESHIVPLSDAAMAIINEMRGMQRASGRESEFVFPGGRSHNKGRLSECTVNEFMNDFLSPCDAVQKAIEAGKIRGAKKPEGAKWCIPDKWRIDCTPHGFRTTFKEWAGEHGYDETDSEMALAHTIGNTVRNIYARNIKRIEPRRQMLQAWADYCARTEPLDAKIIPMRQAKNGEPA